MHNAEVYIVLLRPTTRAPVAGEAVQLEFQGQVELDLFEWTLHNEKESQAAEEHDAAWSKRKGLLEQQGSLDARLRHTREDLERSLSGLEDGYSKDRDSLLEQLRSGDISDTDFHKAERQLRQGLRRERDSLLNKYQSDTHEQRTGDRLKSSEDLVNEALEKQRSDEIADADRNRNFEFSFSKRVDIATTQMLNSMKAGDVFPSGTITIVSRPLSTGMVLTFNIQKIRLLDYALQVETTDTMTHLTEQWTCEFSALAYTYKNRSQTNAAKGAGQTAIQAMTQGTVRAFTMRSAGSPI
jgi:type VI protein secretion system component Hcp